MKYADKKRIILPFLLLAPFAVAAQSVDEQFEEAWQKTAGVSGYWNKVLYGAVTPQWRGDDVFFYSTQGPDGEECYKVDVRSAARTAVPRDSLNAAGRGPAGGAPQGFGGGLPGGMYGGRRSGSNSPDGNMECLIRDNNIWLRRDGKLTQLSFDGNEKEPYIQFLWSPDSRRIAALKKQTHEQRQILLRTSRPSDQVQPTYRWLDYDKPGDDLPQATPALFDAENMCRIALSVQNFDNQYDLGRLHWSQDSRFFTFEYNRRGHQLYQILAVDADGTVRTAYEETSETFIYWNDMYRRWMKDGRLMWVSERDGWRHLYLIDPASGSLQQLTAGQWNVREMQHVDEENGVLLFYASGYPTNRGEDPYNKHLLRLDMASGKLTDLTPDNGNHSVSFNPSHTAFVDVWSRPDMPHVSAVRNAVTGKRILKLQESDASRLLQSGYTMPEVFVAKGRDGKTDIWGNIYRPSDFDPGKSYPVVEYIYAGPHDSYVEKNFRPTDRFTRLVEMGFIVVTIDGMGTDNRSKAFQDVAYRNLKDAGFPDRELWLKAAQKKYPYMNLDNMGVYGYSAGGQNALSALLFFGDFYKVAVALAGCHDNRMDKIWWNEQWMGWPVGPWYSENSNVDNAYRLQGKLLLINGEIDDNVDPASTLQVVAELVKAGKDFEQLYLPGFTHDLGSEYITKRIFRHFWRYCR